MILPVLDIFRCMHIVHNAIFSRPDTFQGHIKGHIKKKKTPTQ